MKSVAQILKKKWTSVKRGSQKKNSRTDKWSSKNIRVLQTKLNWKERCPKKAKLKRMLLKWDFSKKGAQKIEELKSEA